MFNLEEVTKYMLSLWGPFVYLPAVLFTKTQGSVDQPRWATQIPVSYTDCQY